MISKVGTFLDPQKSIYAHFAFIWSPKSSKKNYFLGPTFKIIKERPIQFIFFGPKDSKSAPAPFPAQLEGPPQNLTPPSSHLSSRKAAAQKKAKNATMCLALNVQWSYHSIAAMLSVKSAMMR